MNVQQTILIYPELRDILDPTVFVRPNRSTDRPTFEAIWQGQSGKH